MDYLIENWDLFLWCMASAALATVAILRFWGQKWVESKFHEKVERFKAQISHDLSFSLAQKTKWHDKEQEVLSQCWQKLVTAHDRLKKSISMFRRFPDLNNMTKQEKERHVRVLQYNESEVAYFQSQENKNNAHVKIMEFRELKAAEEAFNLFHEYYEHNKIFLHPDIKEQFDKIDQLIWEAWVSRKMSIDETRIHDFWTKALEKENDEVKPLMQDIENAIQSRLFPQEFIQNND